MTKQTDERNDASSTVTPIRSDVAFTEGKQTFLDLVATRYDQFLSDNPDNPPVALLFAMTTEDGIVLPSYMSLGNMKGGLCAMLVHRMHFVLGMEIQDWEGSYDDDND